MLYSNDPNDSPQGEKQKCIYPDGGDGLWNKWKNTWDIWPCWNKCCPKHWRKWAWREKNWMCNQINVAHNVYHVRIHPRLNAEDSKRKNYLSNFIRNIKADNPGCEIIWVKHDGPQFIHYHLIVMTIGNLQVKKCREAWQKHRPSKRKIPWSGRSIYITKRPSAERLLLYLLRLRKRDQGLPPPWGRMSRNVTKFVGKSKPRKKKKPR